MRCAVFMVTLLVLCAYSQTVGEPGHAWDWEQWQRLPVQDGGRCKPLDTLARETLRLLANRAEFRDPETHLELEATAFYLAMLFEWQGWNRPMDASLAATPAHTAAYFVSHEADKWDRAPLFRVDLLTLRKALGLRPDQKYLSAWELFQADIREPSSGKQVPFLLWASNLQRGQKHRFTTLEENAVQLTERHRAYQAHRMGLRMAVLPITGSADQQWYSVNQLLNARFDTQTDPTGVLGRAREKLLEAQAAYISGSTDRFNRNAAHFIAIVTNGGPQLGSYPELGVIDWELAYNRWMPFRFAWILTFCALLLLLLNTITGWRTFHVLGMLTLIVGLVVMLVGFGWRVAVSGRAPVANMYESVIYMGFGAGLFGLVFALVWRNRYVLMSAAAVSTFALILADSFPAVLDQGFGPLQPALRSNFWLIVHVLTVTLSYSAFALAMGIGNITLGYHLVHSRRWATIDALEIITYRSLQVGVLLLAVGTVTGGVWADYCWGRFWGWDPKEVWALIALLGYLAVLHARHVRWVGCVGLAALSVMCFSLVVIAWYGVNFVLSAGLHSYGFGSGGRIYVSGLLFVQFLYVAAAAARSAGHTRRDSQE